MKIKLANKYFAYLAKRFPVMCASGAFHFMPPVTDAAKWLDRFDELSAKAIAKHVTAISGFRDDFLKLANKTSDQSEEAAARALAQNANGIIMELDGIRSWTLAPEFYLHIAFSGLEQAAHMPAKNERARQKRFIKRLRAIPDLLSHGPANIEATTAACRAGAQTMVRSCARYLTDLGSTELGQTGKGPRYLTAALSALKDYDRFIGMIPELSSFDGPSFEHMATDGYGTTKSTKQIFELAEEEFDNRLESLHWLESEIGDGRSWLALYEGYEGPPDDGMEAHDLIVREIHRLKRFVYENALPGVFADSAMRIDPQPVHLATTLRAIHHDPALGAWDNEPSRCFVSPHIFSGRRFKDTPDRLARIRKEFPFKTAKQTYPGRHLLTSQRLALGDSPMTQVTNPLFMAGWLAFAENLLDELGYIESPMDRLVHHRRGLARAGLAMVDAGLAIGAMDQKRCLSVLKQTGYSTEEALDHVRNIIQTPARRAMAVLGLHEITTLRRQSGLDLPSFCRTLLAGGQLPFDQIAHTLLP